MTSPISLGVCLWSQSSDWPSFLEAATRADELGFDHIWTWDHLLPIFGDTDQPIWEGYVALGALAVATSRAKLGLLVGANTFRNPGLVARSVLTLDHVSGGRAIMGLGGAWFETEHTAFGLDFGSGFGQRLDRLAEAVPAIRVLLDGGTVTSEPGSTYAFSGLRLLPPTLQQRLPIMIGGSGPRKTLPIVARYADMWNAFGSPAELQQRDATLRSMCAEVGRDPDTIERTVGCKITIRRTQAEAERALDVLLANNHLTRVRVADDHTFWTGTPDGIVRIMTEYARVGFGTFICELPAPYDIETLETLVGVVKPMVDQALASPA
jgi:alkanesulfonate monooxygenase SsuD/methylene tetrahydromethanopterin reductase-like flavin-dependent oxidoreductase (luciferase family)